MSDIHAHVNDDDLISQARWLKLAGLSGLEPTAAELTAAELTTKCTGYLWEVTLAGFKDPRMLITADRDMGSVELSMRDMFVDVPVSTIVYRGPIAGTSLITDRALIERMTKLRSFEEQAAKHSIRLGGMSPIEAMLPSDMNFVTKMTQADGTPVVLTLNKAQAADAKRLAKSWYPDRLDVLTDQIIQKACQNASAANVNLSAEAAKLSFFERVQHEVQVLLQSEIDAGRFETAERLSERSSPLGPLSGNIASYIVETPENSDFPCVKKTTVTPDEDAPTGMHHFDS